jgi:TonB family protein
MLKPRHFPLLLIVCALSASVTAQTVAQRIRVAVLDFGETGMGRLAPDKLTQALSLDDRLKMIDREESRAAAHGAGYVGSLNLTLTEARDLGGATGSDFYITGDAQVLRRSPSTGPVYYEAYASIFIVSARTGRLILWDRPSFNAASEDAAAESLLKDLKERAARYVDAISAARALEMDARARILERAGEAPAPVIEDAPEDEKVIARERAEAEATVDVQVEIDASGEVSRVEVVRWAGFGLDDAAVSAVRQLHFSPARRDGQAVPMRVLLRYNFRRPPK